MTNSYFFDTDCLSAFLWVREESLLEKLYGGSIILPEQVYMELGKVPHLLKRVDRMKSRNTLFVESILYGTAEFESYYQMTTKPEKGIRIIGRGEAACIAMVKERGGVIASNNLRDISVYVNKYGLNHITTGDILKEALHKQLITEDEGNQLWQEMLNKQRKLPTKTFSDYLNTYTN